jgi:hypothetical protein
MVILCNLRLSFEGIPVMESHVHYLLRLLTSHPLDVTSLSEFLDKLCDGGRKFLTIYQLPDDLEDHNRGQERLIQGYEASSWN